MSSFLTALSANTTRTQNNMVAHASTGSGVLDLFFGLGTRKLKGRHLKTLFELAWADNKSLAMKTIFYNRDIREGRGERASFREVINHLANMDGEKLAPKVPLIPEYGRWDDLFSLFETPLEGTALAVIRAGIESNNGLCAKWMPRKGPLAVKIREFLQLSPKAYRQKIVALTKVVEQQMCAQQWPEINYSHVPSKAGTNYAKAFFRHDEERYKAWREELKKAPKDRKQAVKINVGTLYPHDVIAQIDSKAYPVQEAWDELKRKFPLTDEKIIPVCDVSGSMNGQPMEICLALGLFLSELNTGPYKDKFITFSAKPKLQLLTGTLAQKRTQLRRADWDMNTNLEAVFELVAQAAKIAKPEDVPKIILILSDMQFDQAVALPSANALTMIDEKFTKLGLKRPAIVFWNLSNYAGTLPVQAHQSGAALVSGFSPTVLKTILTHPGELSPMGMMLSTLNTKRYEALEVA